MLTVLKQELLLRARQGATWGQFLFILVIATAVMSTLRGDSDLGRVQANAPTQLVLYSAGFCLIAGPIVAAIAGTGILRDFELRVHEFFFTSRLKAWQYFFGRYLGSFLVTGLLFTALPLGLWLGTVLPGDTTHLGAFRLAPYSFAYFVILLPNLLLTSALFFVAGALTRNLFAVYALGIGLFVFYLISAGLASGIGSRGAAAALDPFGMVLLTVETRYWTPAQKNVTLPALDGAMLANRIVWSGLGLGMVALGGLLFRFRAQAPQLPRQERGTSAPSPQGPLLPAPVNPQVWRSFLHLVRFHTRTILKSWPYWLFLGFGLIVLLVTGQKEEGSAGTALLPTTSHVVKEVSDAFMVLFVFVAAIYAGELCWQDRILRVAPLVETLPHVNTVATLARFVSLLLILVLAGAVYASVGMLQQVSGGTLPDLTAYAMALLVVSGIPLLSMSALAFLLHSRAPNKFVGHILFVAVTLLPSVFDQFGWDHPLLNLGLMGEPHYSDLDGFGVYRAELWGMGAHWLLVSALFLVLAIRPHRRGRGPALALAGLCALSTCLLLYNFHSIHRFRNENDQKRALADYERRFRGNWLERPQPKITVVDLDVTLWPERSAFTIAGRYVLKNKTTKPISEIFLSFDEDLELTRTQWGAAARRTESYSELGVQVWKLEKPLAPGQNLTLDFTLVWDKPGFAASGPRTDIATNGSFLANLAPRIGYQAEWELTDTAERAKQRLAKWREMPERVGLGQTYIGGDSDWVTLAMTVRTAPDQLALAPGKLVREWRERGRRCFRYESGHAVRYFWAVVSGKYATQKATYKGIPITVYYHPAHPWNVKRILNGAKDALAFCSETFGPYPFSELRIVEFPARGENIAAQAFAGTIPFSEAGGFSLKVEEADFDTPFYVTAHEVAHQWWAHQLTGANLPGSEVLSESLAEYTALRVAVKAGNDSDEVQKRAADGYLKGRAEDRTEEQPLVSTRRQPYICYQKGGLAFHELSWLTNQRLDSILRAYLKVLAFQEPPYPTASNLVKNLKANFPAHQQRITELFEKRTLCDLTAVSATKKILGKKRWQTEIVVKATKVFADGQGNETPAPVHDTIYVSVWNDSEVVTRSVRLEQARQTVRIETDFAPSAIELDPAYHQLDRNHDDNAHSVP
jgi:ABC-2 type transport system permease protein